MEEKTVEINNFIGVYDNYITKDECNKAIQLFNEQQNFKKTFTRMQNENSPSLIKKDEQFFAAPNNIDIWWEELKVMMLNFDIALKHYLQQTGSGEIFPELSYTDLKIQKTLPTEGYHVWHIEHGPGRNNENRALVFSIYLNDIEEGGETEFLHFSKRVKPKTGRIVIWPASFPYVHRGNPPLEGEKYLLTSWMLM